MRTLTRFPEKCERDGSCSNFISCGPSIYGMEIERRKLKRKPFSDVTNQIPNSRSQPCTPPTLSDSVAADSHLSNTSEKIYARRHNLQIAKDKGKSPLLHPLSCPPMARTKRIWDENEQEENGDIILSKKRADSHPRTKKRRNSMPALPRDFVEEQRKYFAEVDAFQLEEEIVSENDLE